MGGALGSFQGRRSHEGSDTLRKGRLVEGRFENGLPLFGPDFDYTSLLVTDKADLLIDNLQTDGCIAVIALGEHEGCGAIVDGRLEDITGTMLMTDPPLRERFHRCGARGEMDCDLLPTPMHW